MSTIPPTPLPTTFSQDIPPKQEDLFTDQYTLYKTENYYTFIKPDTPTGQLWQVYWETEEGNEGMDMMESSGDYRFFLGIGLVVMLIVCAKAKH